MTVEAALAVVDWSFRKRGLAKVYAYTDARNMQSLRVMAKAGHDSRGDIAQPPDVFGTSASTMCTMALLREEWEMGRG